MNNSPVTRACAAVLLSGLLVASGCSRSGKTGTNGSGDTATGTTASPTAATNGDFGTMKAVCGPAVGTNKATGRGVTADSIDLGVISDAGFVGKPGLNQELWDASDVFVQWCNSLGGINGRKLTGTHLDAALTQYKQKVLQACNSEFALVGGGGVLDDAGEPDRIKCLLPSFPGFLLTPTARASELKWQSVPAPLDEINVHLFRWLAQKYPDSIAKVGYLTANLSATVSVGQQIKEATTQLGFKATSFDQQYNSLGEATWVPFATAMKRKGVKGLMFLGEPQNLAKLEQALLAVNYKPEWIATLPNIYDQSFLTATAGHAFNTFIPVSAFPFELADRKAAGSAATIKYLSLFKQYAPKGKVRTGLGIAAFSSWLLFAQAAKPCGADLTPRCLYDNAQRITGFDAGGLIAAANPASGKGSPCQTIAEAGPTGFTIIDADATQGANNCDPSNIAHLKGDYGKGITLADEGKSVADLK